MEKRKLIGRFLRCVWAKEGSEVSGGYGRWPLSGSGEVRDENES